MLLNGVHGIVENIALLDKKGWVALKSANEQSSASSVVLEDKNLSYREINVPSDTLEDLLKRHKITYVDILKMDCEGAEYAIMDSISEKTAQRIGRIIVEYHYVDEQRNCASLIESIKSKGFTIEYCSGADKMGLIMAKNIHAL